MVEQMRDICVSTPTITAPFFVLGVIIIVISFNFTIFLSFFYTTTHLLAPPDYYGVRHVHGLSYTGWLLQTKCRVSMLFCNDFPVTDELLL